jgi:hypothetical protein
LAGQEMAGGCVSLIFTVNEQLGPPLEAHVTVVVPLAKNDPDGGVQVTALHMPLVVGAE